MKEFANLLLFLLCSILFSIVSSQQQTSWRICPADSFVDTGGRQWQKDTEYANGGNIAYFGNPISGTNDDQLYQTERWGTFMYRFPIPQSMWFDVTFYFAEIYDGTAQPGQRVFKVDVEGTTVLNNFCIVNMTAFRSAYSITKTVLGCGSTLDISFRPIVQEPKISGIYITPSTSTAPKVCPTGVTSPPAPEYAKYDYSEALHKVFLFFEAQRSGDLTKARVRRLAWRRNSGMDVSNYNGVDLSGGYYESANRVKFGFPIAASWTYVAWGVINYRGAYENTGEIIYVMDALQWAMDHYIKAHPSKYEFYGQIGCSDPDFSYCGPPEEYNLARPVFKLSTTKPGTELVCEVAAGMAATSIIFRNTNATYSNLLLKHALELFEFGMKYNGSFATSIPDLQSFYPSTSYLDEIAWSALWLYRATGNQTFFDIGRTYYYICCSGYPGWAATWGEKDPALHVMMSQMTGESTPVSLANRFFDNWMPGTEQTVPMTPKGLSYVLEWGSLRYASNAAMLAFMFADYIRTRDLNDPQTREFIPGTRAYNIFNYGVSQINYILGDGGYSYIVGFGSPSPQRVYYLSAWAPTIDFPYRRGGCGDAFFGNLDANRFIAYGAMVGGPRFDDSYPDNRGDYITGEPTTDYPAMFTGALAKLVQYYNLPPFCGTLNLGWSHRNATFQNWSPRLLKNTTMYCSPDYALPLTTGFPSGGNCRSFYDFSYTAQGWSWSYDNRFAQTGVSYVTDNGGQLKLTWTMGGAVSQAYWFVDLFDGTNGLDMGGFNGFKMTVNMVTSGGTLFFAVLNGSNWEFKLSPSTYKGPGTSVVDIFFGGMGPLTDVRTLYLYLSPEAFGPGYAFVDDITFCTYSTTAAVTSAQGIITTSQVNQATTGSRPPVTTRQTVPSRGTTAAPGSRTASTTSTSSTAGPASTTGTGNGGSTTSIASSSSSSTVGISGGITAADPNENSSSIFIISFALLLSFMFLSI